MALGLVTILLRLAALLDPYVTKLETDECLAGYKECKGGRAGEDVVGISKGRTAEQSFDQSFEHTHNMALKICLSLQATWKSLSFLSAQSMFFFLIESQAFRGDRHHYDGLYVVKSVGRKRASTRAVSWCVNNVHLLGQPPIAVKDMVGEEVNELEEPTASARESDAEGDEKYLS
ncbi:hypothetical protein OG21DRAFT_1527328 [Imleria badia]|nr:hypothetical protein OG21DRAFT_1527328 [Imleria badia]